MTSTSFCVLLLLTEPLAVMGVTVVARTADSLTVGWNTDAISTQDRFTVSVAMSRCHGIGVGTWDRRG